MSLLLLEKTVYHARLLRVWKVILKEKPQHLTSDVAAVVEGRRPYFATINLRDRLSPFSSITVSR